MTIFTVFFQMLSLLIMIGCGYVVAKKGMMDAHTNSQLSEVIVKLLNPLLFFSSAANSVGLIPLDTMALTALIAIGMFVIFIAAGILLSPLFDRHPDQQKIFQMMFVFSNLGFIGIPVVNSILGAEYVVYQTALGVQVDAQDAGPPLAQASQEGTGGGGLPHAALLVGDGDDSGQVISP